MKETKYINEELIGLFARKGSITILTELEGSAKRFTQLKKTLSHATLAKRLPELEKFGLIERRIVEGRPPATVYSLTSKGEKALEYLRKSPF